MGALNGALQAQTPSRQRIRFDAGWRFRQDPFSKRRDTPLLSWQTRQARVTDLKKAELPSEGGSGEWHAPAAGEDVFRNGRFAWFRANLGEGAADPNRILHFDGVDDNAMVFVNGKRLKEHAGWNEPFDVRLASAWKTEGANTVVVLVENESGPGGIGNAYVGYEPPEPKPVAAATGYDDHAWRTVHLPHDFVVEGPIDSSADNSHGSRPVSPAWYRKTFTLPATYRGKSVWLDFDGIYRNADVYLNGRKLSNWPSGYASFRFDIARLAHFGGKNVLAVRVDPRKPEGWWYEGGGIYRHVWLNVADLVHIAPWGVFVQSQVKGRSAQLKIQTKLVAGIAKGGKVRVASRVIDPNGRTVSQETRDLTLPGYGSAEIQQSATVPSAVLWSIERPRLYRLETRLMREGRVIDEQTTNFGIRTLRFDKNRGFFLNGKPVKLKGTCNHQDHAGVGIALPDSLFELRIRKLKAMGSNAYRCAHNPPAAELLDACDRLGMLVMDETRHFGDTTLSKAPSKTKATDLSELRSMILRDRNHPSVIMWSLANEEPIQGTPDGARIFSAMAKVVRKLDPSRPLTSAMNGGWGEGISLVEELVGVNYGLEYYDRSRRNQPNIPFFASETASMVSTRGIYESRREAGHVSSYDEHKSYQIASAEEAWRPVAERPWMAGAFIWTGFDYRGEPSPYGWPSVSSQFGILDTCGFPKDVYWYYKAWWGSEPVAHILPHWNWPGKEGQPVDVWVYGNAERYELFLNGHPLGSQNMPRNGHLQWKVPYEPGALTTKGYRGAQVVATDRVETVGTPVAIRLRTERPVLQADGEDVAQIEVEIVDAKGRVVPLAANLVRFTVSGPGQVVGVGNGDPSSHESDKAPERHAFNGRCAVLVGAKTRPGRLVVTATAPGLKAATISLTVNPAAADR